MTASAYAVACLIATGLLDLVFKLYANGRNSRGVMLAGVGVIWASLQTIYIYFWANGFTADSTTLVYGGLAALAVVTSNILLLECVARLPVSIASTIYRLNTIPLLLMAVVFLGEDPGFSRLTGVSFGLLSVYLLYTKTDDANARDTPVFVYWFGVIVAASCIRALYGILSKVGLSNGADADSMMLLAAYGWLAGGLIYLFFDTNRSVRRDACPLVVLAGALVFSIIWFLTRALSLGDAVVVLPIANMGFVAAFVFAILLKLERLTRRKLMAVAAALVSIFLVSFAS